MLSYRDGCKKKVEYLAQAAVSKQDRRMVGPGESDMQILSFESVRRLRRW